MLNRIKNFIPKEIEEKVLKFWEENKIFEKSVKKKASKGEYVFYDGPPFATGLPHYGHILASIIKDAIPRYQTMKGYKVERRWGWDCHGLPVENVVEQELGLKSKKDIEKIGIDKFNQAAKNRVLSFAGDWKKIIPKIGRWVDMENDYKTMDADYTESALWVFKKLFDKGLVYEGYKSMHICPRCETTLSNFEVTQNYKEIDDISVTVKAELVDEPGTYLLAWTTTPWTLPGNVALAVNDNFDYVKIRIMNNELGIKENYILAKDRLVGILKDEKYKIIEEFKGKYLIGKKYKPFFDYYQKGELKHKQNGWKIYGADFVTAGEGTGIVHIAPAFGEDDMNLAQKENLPFIQHVSMDGRFKPEIKDFAGLYVKPKENPQQTDIEILKWLSHNNKLFSKQKITHSYPHCWRCDTPLLNYATSSWFIKVTDLKNKKGGLLDNNKKINWVPKFVGDGRFGNWLADARDWAVSRSRFWGAPLPIWKCGDCKEIKVIGSVKDIKDNTEKSGNKYFIIRHGESETNAQNIVNSNIKHNHFHLTEKGKKEVLASAKKHKNKKIDIIFSSDFERTKETAEIFVDEIGLSKSKIIYDKRLREVNTGIFNGKKPKAYHDYFKSLEEKFYKTPPEGENLNELKNRVTGFLYELEEKYKNKNILIVSHEYPVWLMLSGATGADVKKSLKMRGNKEDFIKTGEVVKFGFSPIPHNENFELDFHRPYIDEVEFECSKCKGTMKRIPDVFDCWFESGAMPYAQAHYPFENKKKFENNFPAEFIAEGIDQTRGWFYTLLVLSTGLFGKSAYKNVVVNGIVLAEDGQKMSKRLKNYPDPTEIISKYGADAMRLYLLSSPAVRGENLNFSEKGVDELYKKTILRLWNVFNFYNTYADKKSKNNKTSKSKNVLDKWIVSRLNQLISEVSKAMDKYELDRAAKPLSEFVDDLSTWYLRRS
ncbi:MAG: class I tRNA ligase family protein, partial [Patescibacteria group bacterium]